MPGPRFLDTSRLSLRLFALDELEEIHAVVFQDPLVAVPWLGRTFALDELRRPNGFLSRISRDPSEPGLVAIERSHDRALVGLVGIERWPEPLPVDLPEGEGAAGFLTCALGRAYRRRGYATEASQAYLRHAFQRFRLTRLVQTVPADQPAPLALLRRLGFTTSPHGAGAILATLTVPRDAVEASNGTDNRPGEGGAR